ncbi:membrane protein [Streptomyces rubellomurinus]|uniref:Membrane protein n=2 Tax=Streptomyces TaxID=1883 RepID=A0A0F2TL30_STRR3|nr:membrane protein [Streptomyces rubellomurinus]KJS56055.1 membrane protein [Streptomyces rubellomurinus subsp. indigoferus]KJS63231.1 membrane protein [Streptomyces rubellomurinus]
MAQSVHRMPALTLNTDGHPHPRENTLVALTAVMGVIAFTTSFFYNLHVLTSWTGLAGIITGFWGMFVSVTTAERFVLMITLGASAVGFYLGIARGGLIG